MPRSTTWVWWSRRSSTWARASATWLSARVLEIGAIAGADRIRRVVVEAGADPLEVVCGAWNFAVGDLVPFAPVGSVLPGGFEIAARKMNGVVSNGMLCSGHELGLSDDGAGLLILGEDAPGAPGRPSSTPSGSSPTSSSSIAVEGNRPDAWCMAGVARDLAGRLGIAFTVPEPPDPRSSGRPIESLATASVESDDLCPRFTARVLIDVEVAPSPQWMARRLRLAGMRPINNVVDASNYVMLELGQPTHPYDLAKLPGRGLPVAARPPGRDGRRHSTAWRAPSVSRVEPGGHRRDCLICDAEDTPIGIGGIMGGASSGDLVLDHRGAARGGVLHAHGHRPHLEASGAAHRGLGPLRTGL